MENRKNIIFLELPFELFTVNLAWIPDDKAANEVARVIVKESFIHKIKLERFIADNGVKEREAYVLACGKEYSMEHGFTGDFELVEANTIVFKKAFKGVFDKAIHVALTDDFENYENREKLYQIIFLCFFHELLHLVCEIKSERLVDKIIENFRKAISTM